MDKTQYIGGDAQWVKVDQLCAEIQAQLYLVKVMYQLGENHS